MVVKETYLSTKQDTTKTNKKKTNLKSRSTDLIHNVGIITLHQSLYTQLRNLHTRRTCVFKHVSVRTVESIRYTITTSIFSFFEYVHSFLRINLCIYRYDVYNRCFYVNVITVNTKVNSELYK